MTILRILISERVVVRLDSNYEKVLCLDAGCPQTRGKTRAEAKPLKLYTTNPAPFLVTKQPMFSQTEGF